MEITFSRSHSVLMPTHGPCNASVMSGDSGLGSYRHTVAGPIVNGIARVSEPEVSTSSSATNLDKPDIVQELFRPVCRDSGYVSPHYVGNTK